MTVTLIFLNSYQFGKFCSFMFKNLKKVARAVVQVRDVAKGSLVLKFCSVVFIWFYT